MVSSGDRDLVVTVGGRRSGSRDPCRHLAAGARRGPTPRAWLALGRYFPPRLESHSGRVAESSPLTAGTGLPRTLAYILVVSDGLPTGPERDNERNLHL